ncbi:hypothetical protein JG687_00006034 [Phytophthora cactorum]|uniref:Uncharacterized protein n=1 Tax=Phytophthora cactorum TaxID=29920 RepID=A0A8T1UJ73_9STRA|nr:hypothetical protein JG687_00006034 [Phytophthora cactorum]
MGEVSQHEAIAKTEHNLTPKRVDLSSKRYHAVFSVCGRLRQLALVSIAAMGLWPLVLQVILVPQSVFGDGHGDRYEQLSYFAFENDHYQVLAPRQLDCSELQAVLFNGAVPKPTTDLVRAVPQSIFENVRAFVVNKTTGDHETMLSVSTEILGLPVEKSVCFGGVDDEGAIQIEALLSAKDSPIFGVDASCLETSDSHLRLRLQSTEFYVPDTMGELNPSRTSGAMLIASLVGANLNPVGSSCYEATRKARNVETQSNSQYLRLVSVYSKQLIVPETCAEFTLYGGKRDQLGCAYSALGTSGAVANLNSDGAQRTYSFPAPWRMIQCSLSGECSSLLFTQMWLSEWTMEKTPIGEVLRQNFVNHKVNEVTVDSTFSIRLVISLQILALVVTAYLTMMSDPEERSAITDLATKLVTGTKAFGKNIKAAWFVKYGSMFNDQQIAMRLFMKHNIDPDLVYRWLNLKKLKNQSNYLHPIETPEMELWRKYKDVWVRHFPGWKSKIVGDL